MAGNALKKSFNEPTQEEVDAYVSAAAALRDNNPAVLEFLDKFPDFVDAVNGRGWTALRISALHGHKGNIKLLLERGADAHGETVEGRTALMYAEQFSHPAAAAILREWIEREKWLADTDFSKGLKRAIPATRPLKRRG